MGIIESARGVLWARRRQPDEIAYGIQDPLGLVRVYGEEVLPKLREG